MSGCIDCGGPVHGAPKQPRCARCAEVFARPDTAAEIESRLSAVEARRRYDAKLGRRSLEPDDAWAQPASRPVTGLDLR